MTRTAVGDAWSSLRPYAQRTREDPALQRRMLAAFVAAVAAMQRMRLRRKPTVAQLVEDPVFRADFLELVEELHQVRRRFRRGQTHRVAKTMLALTGVGLIVMALRTDRVRAVMSGRVEDGRETVLPETSATEF